jgi:uncharacterized protein (DUF1778 family)
MIERYVLRPDHNGFMVQDVLTGQPAIVAGARQVRLSEADARHMAKLLNEREDASDCAVRPEASAS